MKDFKYECERFYRDVNWVALKDKYEGEDQMENFAETEFQEMVEEDRRERARDMSRV